MVAYADSEWMALYGVILTSASSGLGEVSFLAYSAEYHKYVNYIVLVNNSIEDALRMCTLAISVHKFNLKNKF